MTDPNVVILNSAWSLLWRPASPYYLPTVLANGATFGGTTIPSLTSVAIPDLSFPLYSSPTWGSVTIKLTKAMVAGIPKLQPVSFVPSSDARSVTATVSFTNLVFSGDYEVDGTGVVGCAMDLAETQVYGAMAAAAPPAANMNLARDYRDELAKSGNGVSLVSKYYDHNDTINRILNGTNAFRTAWPKGVKPGAHDTAFYMQQTASAATPDHRGDPDYTVGGNDNGFVSHGVYMQTLLIGTCNYYINNDPERAADYQALRDDTASFKHYTDQYPNPMTVNTVLAAVQNAQPMTQEELDAVPEPEVVTQAREAAERDFPVLQQQALAEAAARAVQATTYQSNGKFVFEFPMPTLTFSGDVAIYGTPPRLEPAVTLTKLQAAIPHLQIDLLSGSDPGLTADAQSQINGAQWFQSVLGSNVNTQLGSQSVRDYLSKVINQAIANITGG
jgi:hypothetical protein